MRPRLRYHGSMITRRVAAAALVVAAAAMAGGTWYRTLTGEPATGPQRMTWHKADGSPPTDPPGDPYPFHGCDGDMYFNIAVWNGGVILPCEDEAIGIGWAFLDPRTHNATLRWPLPNGGKIPVTRGLVLGPDHQLAIVFEAPFLGDLFVGVARPEGWSRLPENLGRVKYHAAAWVGATLELVVTPVSPEGELGQNAPIKVVSLDGAERREWIGLPACDEPCLMPDIVYRAGSRWVFERSGYAVAEGGKPVSPALDDPAFHAESDLVAHGKLDAPATLRLGEDTPVIGADGKPTHSAQLPWDGLVVARQARYEIDDAIHRRPQWTTDRRHRAIVEKVGGRALTWHTDEDDRVRITDARLPPDTTPPVRPVVRWSRSLATRMFVPDDAGGFWLVDGSGEYIHLDRALHRTDPLPLREHLRQRGSLGTFIDEPAHEEALGWALLGFPILLVGCMAMGWFIGPRRPIVRGKPIVVAAVLYLATAAWALLQVAPLL